jgi:hypothetical protein
MLMLPFPGIYGRIKGCLVCWTENSKQHKSRGTGPVAVTYTAAAPENTTVVEDRSRMIVSRLRTWLY